MLNVLAGRLYGAKNLEYSANISLDGVPVNPLTDIKVRKQIAFVEQHDTLHIASTPREAIKFSARLRLSATTSEEELNSLTESTLKELGLEGCANTIVGGERLKGISGGERKRAAIGVELVTKVSISVYFPFSRMWIFIACSLILHPFWSPPLAAIIDIPGRTDKWLGQVRISCTITWKRTLQ